MVSHGARFQREPQITKNKSTFLAENTPTRGQHRFNFANNYARVEYDSQFTSDRKERVTSSRPRGIPKGTNMSSPRTNVKANNASLYTI